MNPRGRGDEKLLDALERWLGADLFDRSHAVDYLTAFHDITAATIGLAIGKGDQGTDWFAAFEAYLDGYATHALRRLLPSRNTRRVHRQRPSATDPPGFVSSEMVAGVPINTATVDELRAVPGIGARLAHRIVSERDRFGPFERLGELARVPGFRRDSYVLAAPFLTVKPDQLPLVHRELANRSSIEFPQFIHFLHGTDLLLPGRRSSSAALSLAELAVREVDLAAALARSAPYWHRHRYMDPTRVRLRQRDRERGESIVRASRAQSVSKVAPVTNNHYLNVLRNLIESSTKSIRISVHQMRLGSPKLKAEVLVPLIAAKARPVEVRILLGRDQVDLTEADRATVARLEGSGIPVHYDLGEGMMHRKAIIVDQGFLLVGSHNLTPNSIFKSEELSLLVQDGLLAGAEAKHFDDLWRASQPGQSGESQRRSADGAGT